WRSGRRTGWPSLGSLADTRVSRATPWGLGATPWVAGRGVLSAGECGGQFAPGARSRIGRRRGEEVRMKGLRLGVALGGTLVAAVAVGVGGAAAREAAAPDVTLAGFTSQQYPAFFKLSGSGQMLTLGAIALDMNCTSGDEFVLHDAFGRVRIKPNGRIRASVV